MARIRVPTDDFRGPRGSNTGDDFHELWATRHAIGLLSREGGLTAIAVEGLAAADQHGEPKGSWDGVDCTLYYGGIDARANSITIEQLKYSAANPKTPWTIARLVAGRRRDYPLLQSSRRPLLHCANSDRSYLRHELSSSAINLSIRPYVKLWNELRQNPYRCLEPNQLTVQRTNSSSRMQRASPLWSSGLSQRHCGLKEVLALAFFWKSKCSRRFQSGLTWRFSR